MSHARRRSFSPPSCSETSAASSPPAWAVALSHSLWPFWLFKDANQGDLYDALATDVARRLDVFVLMAAGSGLICAYAVCVVLVIGYAWCYLRLAER
jgi:hypothetical protein